MKFSLLLILISLQIFASDAFISSLELKNKLDAKNLVILDVTDADTYKLGHIPHAVSTNVSSWRHSVEKHQLINSPSDVQSLARSLGINNDSQVIIYGHGKKKELLQASYISLALITNGLNKVSILDGGYDDWLFDCKKLTSNQAEDVKLGNFASKFNPDIIVDMNYVKEHIGKTPMLEARPADFYYGTSQSGGVERLGHIPHAMSSFWKDKFQADETLRSQEDLDAIFIKGYELDPKKEVILYCTGGLEASMNWYILYQQMGFKNAKIYDGSMREWGNTQGTPMTTFKWETFYN